MTFKQISISHRKFMFNKTNLQRPYKIFSLCRKHKNIKAQFRPKRSWTILLISKPSSHTLRVKRSLASLWIISSGKKFSFRHPNNPVGPFLIEKDEVYGKIFLHACVVVEKNNAPSNTLQIICAILSDIKRCAAVSFKSLIPTPDNFQTLLKHTLQTDTF